jgi:GT2 family glycosyltransferase
MKICCVIVTYGNRFHLLSRVIEAVVAQGVGEIIVIDNNSHPASQKKIDEIASNSLIPVRIIRYSSNSGSANGFSAGMKAFLKSDSDFIWILDDDNKPTAGALEKLIQYWKNTQFLCKDERLMLTAFRQNRVLYLEAIQKNNPDLILPAKNSFCGFHMKQVFNKLRERFFYTVKPVKADSKTGKLNAAAYGGLFFHRNLLAKTPLPNVNYFLYMDDFAFTYSFVQGGGEIWLLSDSVIEDIETAFYLPGKKKVFYHSSLDGEKDYLVYYAVRNNVYFTLSQRVTNTVVYKLNEIIFMVILSLVGFFRRKQKRLRVIYNAMNDGKKGKMGANGKYPLEEGR